MGVREEIAQIRELEGDIEYVAAQAVADTAETLMNLLEEIVENTQPTLNPGGYLVLDDPKGDPQGTMTICIDLTPEEIDIMKEILGG